MATNQNYGVPQRKGSLFNPGLFDDPDAIATAALAENPPAQAPSPDVMNNAPVTGMVPKSFTEYAADPINVAKIPERVPPNTPMPSLVARAVKAAIPSPADMPPPVDSSLAGSPESQPLFPDAQPAAGAKGAPSLEDAIMAGPPNGGAGITAAAQQPQAPAGPLSKEDFLAQHPVKLPNAPYVPHGGKLALTGLFAALDNAGAFLDHGTPSVGPGLMHNVQALQEFNQNLPASTAQAQQSAYDEYLKNYGSIRQNTLSPITTIGPNGQPITTYVDPATQKGLLTANTKAGSSLITTQIKADSAEDVARLKLAFQSGKVARVMPVKMQDGSAGMAAYDVQGNLLHTIPGALPPAAYLPSTSSTQEVKEDGNGGYIIIPKTDTKAANLSGVAGVGAPGAQRTPMTPPKPTLQAANAGGPGATPSASAGPSAHPNVTPQGSAPSQPAGAPRRTGQPPSGPIARPVMNADGSQAGGKSSTDAGYAYNPQTNQTMLTTRTEAAQNGLQSFRKVSQGDIEKDRQVTGRLNDVERKLTVYSEAMANIPEEDQNKMAYLLNSDHFKLGAFGAEIPVDEINQFARQARIGELSPAGVKALSSYYNARESMSGYQRVLQGSARGGEKTMQLNLDALPRPTDPKTYIKEGMRQFLENIPIMRQGLPVLPGMSQSGMNGAPGAQPTPQAGGNGQPQKKSSINFVPDK